MIDKIKEIISHDNAVMNTFLKEYDFYTESYDNEVNWYSLRHKVDLRVFYKVMNINYNLYRYYGNETFIEALQETYKCNRSLDTILRVCHLSPYIFFEGNDIKHSYELFIDYSYNYRPAVIDLVYSHLLEEDHVDKPPF